SDGTTADCTTVVNWSSSNSGIATVSNSQPTKGLVTGVGVGNTTISASLGGATGSSTITVTSASLTSITVSPDPTVAKGTTVQMTATGNFSDGAIRNRTHQMSWTSGNNAIAEVSNASGSQGLVNGLSVGSTPITATLDGVSGSSTVNVTAATLTSIVVAPKDSSLPPNPSIPSIPKGTTVQLIAT